MVDVNRRLLRAIERQRAARELLEIAARAAADAARIAARPRTKAKREAGRSHLGDVR